jgi:hypothetical protein
MDRHLSAEYFTSEIRLTFRRCGKILTIALFGFFALVFYDGKGESSFIPRLFINQGQPVVNSPLVTVTLNFDDLAPVEMAFQQDDSPFSPWEPYQSIRRWPMENPEQTYKTYLSNLDQGRSFSSWDNEYGALAWGESFILESLLNMYKATGDGEYLEHFVVHAEAVIAQGDDRSGRPDHRGQMLPGWGTAGPITLAHIILPDSWGQPALEVSGRSQLRQNQVAVRLALSSTVTDTLWTLDVHRSMPGRMGLVVTDTEPSVTAPDWDIQSAPQVLYPGDSLVYDTFYPWFMIAEIRLYGIQDEGLRADDFELYTAMHADEGEYTRIASFSLFSIVDNGRPVLAFQNLTEWGRYWKVRYVGERPLSLQPEPGALIRIYETGFPPVSERFNASTLEVLVALIEQNSTLVRAQIVGEQLPLSSLYWRFLTPQRYRMALHTGLVTYPLLRFAMLVERENLTTWQSTAQAFLEYARAAVDSHADEWYSSTNTRGYYIHPYDAPVWCNGVNLPFNQQAAIGRSLIALCELTSGDSYCTRAEQIAQVLRDGLLYDPSTDSYWWYYWFGEGYDGWEDVAGRFIPTYPGFKGVEPIYYASLDSDFAQLAHRHGMAFSQYDILRLANTFLHQLTTEKGLLHCYVNGNGGETTLSTAQAVDLFALDILAGFPNTLSGGCAYGDKMTATEYLGLTNLFPSVYQRVGVVEPFPPSLKNSGRAPYGLSQMIYYATWRLPTQPGDHTLCVRVRDVQENTNGPWCVEVALNQWRVFLPFLQRANGQGK